MAKPLDGVALPAYFRRLGYERSTRDLLIHIRNSPPSRTPGARRGNMPVWYPSKKMQCIIKAESAKVEFALQQLCGQILNPTESSKLFSKAQAATTWPSLSALMMHCI